MTRTVRVNEYYDLFNILVKPSTDELSVMDGVLPRVIKATEQTNPFSGFWNDNNFANENRTLTTPPATYTANNVIVISGKVKAPQAVNALHLDDDGNIWCYPPNVSVPYWNKIIFRNYDYTINDSTSNAYAQQFIDSGTFENPDDDVNDDQNQLVYTVVKGDNLPSIEIHHYDQCPLFLRFDQYPSRSKVIFSGCDKTRNPDIEFKFSYHHGQMEPIKLNLSLSASNPIYDETSKNKYNYNLNVSQITDLLTKCYWCIEWIYEPESGN